MGHKQPLFLVIGIIVFGFGVALALYVYGESNLYSHRDSLLHDLRHIGSDAVQFRMRPKSMGGGGGSYQGYSIPSKLTVTEHARFQIVGEPTTKLLTLRAFSIFRIGTIDAVIDSAGRFQFAGATGEFQ